jgi:hypothetical protein
MALHWELFDATDDTPFGLIDLNGSTANSDGQGGIIVEDNYHPMPPYYGYFMLANFFGDRSVEAQSSRPETLSAWGTIVTDDSTRAYLLLVNFAGSVNVQVTVQGINAQSAKIWTMSNPEFAAAQNKETVEEGTSINGLQIDDTSSNTIMSSAQRIINSGVPVTVSNGVLTVPMPSCSAVAIELSEDAITPADYWRLY